MSTNSASSYFYVVEHQLHAVVSTNAGPLTLPYRQAVQEANRYALLYPGTEFSVIYSDSETNEEFIEQCIQLPIDPANSGGLCWSVLSKLEWLELLANNKKLIACLSAVCRQC